MKSPKVKTLNDMLKQLDDILTAAVVWSIISDTFGLLG